MPLDQRKSVMIVAVVLAWGSQAFLSGRAWSAPAGRFVISIDRPMWAKWGFRYPATYVFRVSGKTDTAQVRRRDGGSNPWTALPRKTPAEFFNGMECVRFDESQGKAMVSVGFGATNAVELEVSGVAAVQFEHIARYYDDRDAAYSLSIDNWGWRSTARPGAEWKGPADDASDKYQAALAVCRSLHLPVSIAINSGAAGGEAMWRAMQDELNRNDSAWEPAVHARAHPSRAADYAAGGYREEILGCRDDLLRHLRNIPYGQHVFEHILTSGYQDDTIYRTDTREFLFVRAFNGRDNPSSTAYASWDEPYGYYGPGGMSTKDYDAVLARREPKGRFAPGDVAELDRAFDQVAGAGLIFYALWHPDRYQNSVLYDPAPGVDGQRGSTLVQHLGHVANRRNVWYVANGWLYSYRYVAEHAQVRGQ